MFLRLSLALGIAGFWMSSATAQSETFGWKRLLGQSPAAFAKAIAPTIRCVDVGFVTYDVPVINDKTEVASYWSYDRPLSGSMFSESIKARSQSVTRVVCKLDDVARIEAYAHNGSIYRIEIAYLRCAPTCIVHERPYDVSLFQATKVKDAFTPDGYPPKNADRFYLFVFEHIDKNPALQRNLRGQSCWTGMGGMGGSLPPYRCIIDVSVTDGVWHSIAMMETLDRGWVYDTVTARLAARQEFSLLTNEQEAERAFIAEVRALLAERRATQLEAARKAQQQQKMKDDLLGKTQ